MADDQAVKGDAGWSTRVSSTAGPAVPADFEQMFRNNYRPLVRLLSLASDDAADAVQEAFIEAFHHWDDLAHHDNVVAWLRKVAVNKLRDHGRRRGRQLRLAERLRQLRPANRDPLGGLDVAAAIARLPPRQRLAMSLHYLGDLSVEDVADAMDITAGAVKSSLHSGRKNLRSILEVLDEDD